MSNPRGRVISVADSETTPRAVVEIDAVLGCSRCMAGKGCGAALLGGDRGSRRVDATVSAGLCVSAGDEVRIELEPSRLLHASLLVYGLPLGGAVAAAIVASLVGVGEGAALMSTVGGAIAGFLGARAGLRRAGCLRHFNPTVVERLSGDCL